MHNILKADKQPQTQPVIIAFASPSFTPSNNYKQYNHICFHFPFRIFNQTKDLNSSIIQGRKVDSPQLRVVSKDIFERPQTAHMQQTNNLKREEFLAFYNSQGNNQLNQTNKEIQKKQLDVNIKNQKANVTIQYDEKATTQQHPRHHKGSKSINQQIKKRQSSQSAPKHQPSASIANTQVQPIINLHIQNAKLAQQAKMTQSKKKNEGAHKHQSQHHGGKSKTKSQMKGEKHSSMKGLQKSIVKAQKQLLNHSNIQGYKYNDFGFNFDNKENQSINYNEFSPSRIIQKNGKNNFLDSDSSISSPKPTEHMIVNQLGKSYFMDKSVLLKHLSPDRSQRVQQQARFQPSQQQLNIGSDRERNNSKEPQVNAKSYGSTITTQLQPQLLQGDISVPKMANETKHIKIKRSGTSNSNGNKIYLKGVDKIIKENIKKIKNKEEEEVSRRFFEEYKQKMKKVELSQRNQEVRKINASKIIYNHKPKNSQISNMLLQKVGYKKQRSKSCMNKTDNIFGGLPRSKERLPQQYQQQHPQQEIAVTKNETKKEKKREKSFVLELKELKKQIDEEIRREILAGKLEVPTATHKRTNLTTLNAKKEMPMSSKKEFLNMSAFDGKALKHNNNSKGDITMIKQQRKRSKSKDISNNANLKIKKFIEKKKKLQIAAKSLEQTIENEKQLKIQKNLKNLNHFVKSHFRHQSFNFYFKKPPQLNKDNSAGVDYSSGNLPVKKLKPHFYKVKKGNKDKDQKKQIFNFQGDTIFDNDLQENETPMKFDYNVKDDDVSREFYEDYQKLINSINKNQKQQKQRKDTSKSKSNNGTPLRSTSHKKKKLKPKKMKVYNYVETFDNQEHRNQKDQYEVRKQDTQSSQESKQQLTAIKKDLGFASVKPNNVPTLIPPQSDIATIEKHLEKSNITLKELDTEQKSQYRQRTSQGSLVKSPNTVEFKKRMMSLMALYGKNIQKTEGKKISDTKLLIKLHSAAITIQQQFRKLLQRKGFYDTDRDNSQMYVDSEEEEKYEYEFTSAKKKSESHPLIAQTSPLRVKKQYQQRNFVEDEEKRTGPNKFYSHDSSDNEKVIVCSVISSARPEGEESLQTTQKYVPLRQKNTVKKHVIQPSSTSSANSQAFNTAIKTNQALPIQTRLNMDNSQQQDLSSQRKQSLVPSLNLKKLSEGGEKPRDQPHPQQQQQLYEETKRESSTNRSIFDRHTFQDFQNTHNADDFNPNNYPEFLKIREEIIKYKEQEEHNLLQKMFKSKQLTPRTYEQKRKDLEIWVTKEKEEVKKTKKVFEEQWQKTAQIIEQTQKNQDLMKKIFKQGDHSSNEIHQKHHKHDNMQSESSYRQPLLSSHRMQSSRIESKLLEMIYEDERKKDKTPQPDSSANTTAPKLKEQIEEQQKLREEIEKQRKEQQLQKVEEEKRKQAELKKKQQQEEKERKDMEQKEKQQEIEIKRKREEEEQRKKIQKEEEERKLKAQKNEEIKKKKQIQEENQRKQEAFEKKEKELEQIRIENERKEKIRQDQEKREMERKEQERREQERKEQELKDKERKEQERKELEKKEQQRKEQERKEQERKQQQLKEQERKEQERKEQERKAKEQRDLELQAEEQRKINERLSLEKIEQERIKKEQEESLKKKRDEEERLRKEQMDKERIAKEKELERQKIEREEKQKEMQAQKEQMEKKNQEIQRKLEMMEAKFEKKKSQEDIKTNSAAFQYGLKKQQRYDFDERVKEEELNSEPDFLKEDSEIDEEDFFTQKREDQLIQNILNQDKQSRIKEVLDTNEEEQTPIENKKDGLTYSPFQDRSKDDEPTRHLSRTRSSQYLKENRDATEEQFNQQLSNGSDNDHLSSEERRKLFKDGLHDESVDENFKILQEVTKQGQLGGAMQQNDFFTKNFDNEKATDIMEKIKNTTARGTELQQMIQGVDNLKVNDIIDENDIILEDSEKKEDNKKNSNIYIEDKGEEVTDNNVQVQIRFQLQQDATGNQNRQRLTSDMRNQIPTEEEERYFPGMPVSPASQEGQDIRIQTGSQSLESTLSDGREIKQAISEVSKENVQNMNEKDQIVDSITDDIFRAMMNEMKIDLDFLLISDPRKLFKEEQTNHAASGNHYLSESGRFLIFERRGIKTDLFAIERYVEEVLEEVLKERMKFMNGIQTPLSKNAREVLNQLQNSEIGSYEHFEVNYPAVLSLDMYLRLEKRRKENREREQQETNVDKNFLAECEHIHNKVLFDCINDSLLQFKPYGKEGAPLPWSRQNRRLKPIEDFTIEEMFEIVKHDVIIFYSLYFHQLFRWAIMQAGTLPRREFVFGGVFDDELFAEIREKKLATLLAREMIENEPKWLNYEFEEAQVKIDIGDMILEQLVTETITILNDKIGNRSFI